MGFLRSFDHRREPRKRRELPLMVWGVDARGERFLQEAHAHDISISGALFSSLDADIKSGDVIGVLFGKKKARYRVVWISYDSAGDKMLVAVHRLESDECPWLTCSRKETSQRRSRTVTQSFRRVGVHRPDAAL